MSNRILRGDNGISFRNPFPLTWPLPRGLVGNAVVSGGSAFAGSYEDTNLDPANATVTHIQTWE